MSDVRKPETRVTDGEREGVVQSYRYGLVYVQWDGDETMTAHEPGAFEVVS